MTDQPDSEAATIAVPVATLRDLAAFSDSLREHLMNMWCVVEGNELATLEVRAATTAAALARNWQQFNDMLRPSVRRCFRDAYAIADAVDELTPPDETDVT